MAGDASRDTEQVIERIREVNEQVLDVGRKAGLEFLDAYEQTLRAFADYSDKLADTTQVDSISQMLRSQAKFTRDVIGAYTEAVRSSLGR